MSESGSETEWKTLRVPKSSWEKAKQQKEEHDRTWGEQIVRDNDHAPLTEDDVREIVREMVSEDALR